jgi:hypothetical protein
MAAWCQPLVHVPAAVLVSALPAGEGSFEGERVGDGVVGV